MTTVTTPDLFAVDDLTASSLAAEYPTPAFGYRLDLARERFTRLREVLPARVQLAYAVKANPGQPLLDALAALGAWFDCASAGEVRRVVSARAAGDRLPPHSASSGRLVLAGPGKRENDLRAGLAAGARVQVDGLEDVARLQQWWDGPDPLPVSVRVHPGSGIDEQAAIIGGAGPSAFGVDEEELPAFLAAAGRYDRVRVAGLQVFAASNELDVDRLLGNHEVALRIGERMSRDHGLALDLIDLGGGLGVPYRADEGELDVAALGDGLARLLERHDWFTGDLLLEPGRWLSAPIGVYLTRVVRTKHSRGTDFAVLEGGINHLLRPLLTGQSFPVRRVWRARDAAERDTPVQAAGQAAADLGEDAPPRTWTLAGPLCTSLDRVGTAELAGDLAPGDVLAFGQAGAYAVTQAMTHFLSHPLPEEIWLEA